MKKLEQFIKRHELLGIDTCIFIFQLERNPKYFDLANKVFMWVEKLNGKAFTSTITMLELLVAPYRERNIEKVNQIYAILATFPNLEWVTPTLGVADLAARLRAKYNLKTPDSIQLASALESRASGFITNDKIYKKVTEIEIMIFDELL